MSQKLTSRELTAFAGYLVTGFLQPTIIDWIKYNGGTGQPSLVLPTMFNCLGMAMVLLLPLSDKDGTIAAYLTLEPELRRPVALCTAVDLVSGALVTIGLLMVGSGMCRFDHR
jgi:hypothetical protein